MFPWWRPTVTWPCACHVTLIIIVFKDTRCSNRRPCSPLAGGKSLVLPCEDCVRFRDSKVPGYSPAFLSTCSETRVDHIRRWDSVSSASPRSRTTFFPSKMFVLLFLRLEQYFSGQKKFYNFGDGFFRFGGVTLVEIEAVTRSENFSLNTWENLYCGVLYLQLIKLIS